MTNDGLREAIEIKWAHQDRVNVAVLWYNERALFELESNPLSDRDKNLLEEFRPKPAQRTYQGPPINVFDAWTFVNNLRKRHFWLGNGKDAEGNIHPALRKIDIHSRNITDIQYFDQDKLEDLSEHEPALQSYDAQTGALVKAKSYTRGIFNYELDRNQLSYVAQSKGVPLKPRGQVPQSLKWLRVDLKQV